LALEATGPYWLALFEYLTHAEFPVAVFNPLQVHAYRKTGVRRTKTDQVDAFWIADLLRVGCGSAKPQPDGTVLQLRELARFRWHLMDQIGDNKRKVLNVLDRVFPEYETLFSDVFLSSSRALLKQAANADEFATFDLGELTALLHTHSRGRFGLAHAQKNCGHRQDFDWHFVFGGCRPTRSGVFGRPNRFPANPSRTSRRRTGRVADPRAATFDHHSRTRSGDCRNGLG
jgi:hypothetical protein